MKYYMDLSDPEVRELFAMHIPDDVYEKYRLKYIERENQRNAKKILIETLIKEIIEETKKIKRRDLEQKLAAERNAELFMDVNNIGVFTGKLQYEEIKNLRDSEEDEIGRLIMEQAVKHDDDRQQQMKNAQNALTKEHFNERSMLAPQKNLTMNYFARTLTNGIIWHDIKDKKVHPKVLRNEQLARGLGLKFMLRLIDRVQEKRDEGNIISMPQTAASQDPEDATLLFEESEKKYQFYQVAKKVAADESIEDVEYHRKKAYKKFYRACADSNTLALPLFTCENNQVMSIVG